MDVLTFTEYATTPFRTALDGIRRFASTAAWRVRVVETAKCRKGIWEIASAWRPAGIIVYCAPPAVASRPRRGNFGCPVVFLNRNPSQATAGDSIVFHDSVNTGRIAANELLRAGCERFAYVGWPSGCDWSEARRCGFENELAEYGKTSVAFRRRWRSDDIALARAEIAQWLMSIERPVGVFAANDEVAELVADACVKNGMSIPGDVAIVGCDDDEKRCEAVRPTITSIRPDFAEGGWKAARLLADLMEGGRGGARISYSDIAVVRRQSTRIVMKPSPVVAAALEYIRTGATSGMRVMDVVSRMGCSRRTAEMMFKKATGRSILEEINDVRLEHAKLLLRDPLRKIGGIAAMCGWRGENFLKRLFKASTGMTMAEWRARTVSSRMGRR